MNNKIEPKASICLTMIVKDEEKVIERCLKSVEPIIDYYIIVDTGSTDKTKEIVSEFFKDKKIQGKVVDHKWKNFGDARNRAIDEAESLMDDLNVENVVGYWQDADEQLVVEDGFNVDIFKTKLNGFDSANILVKYNSQIYHRMQFYKLFKGWEFEGPLHEVLINEDVENLKAATIQGIHVLVTPDGNSWTSQNIKQKYEGHAKILEDYVLNDVKKDPRWVFYLAQSYRDCEDNKKSIEWYEKRCSMQGGYWEEVYYSKLMIASLKAKENEPIHEILESYRRCGSVNPFRVEHLIPIILYYQSIKDFETAYVYSSHAMKYAGKEPDKRSVLFVDMPIYLWKIFDLHTVSCWYSNRKDESTQTFKKLWKQVERGFVSEPDLTRIKDNKKFFQNKK